MAGESWFHVVPYEPDPAQALQRLRHSVYRERFASQGGSAGPVSWVERIRPGVTEAMVSACTGPFGGMVEESLLPSREEIRAAAKDDPAHFLVLVRRVGRLVGDMAEWTGHLKALTAAAKKGFEVPPRGADEDIDQQIARLLTRTGEAGTSTILDVPEISTQPDFGRATPAPPRRLKEVFGSDRPARKELDRARMLELAEGCENWSALYFAAFEGETPTDWVFVGASGD